MTKEELAVMLDGRQYLEETDFQVEQLARDNNLLIVFGASDDLCEFRGAIDDEFGCFEGGTITHEELLRPIEAIWCPKDAECSWGYKTDLPYSEFRIFEDNEAYCVGIVVDLNNQWERNDKSTLNLKPCPFCGGKANIIVYDPWSNLGFLLEHNKDDNPTCPIAHETDARFGREIYDSREDAAKAWNTRLGENADLK